MSNAPTEAHIQDCVRQMTDNKTITHSERTQGYAQLRLADFSAVLNEWALPHDNSQPLPNVHQALLDKNGVDEQKAQQIVAFVQQQAKQGNYTALLYWTYCLARGLGTAQQPQKAAQLVKQLSVRGDERASRWLGEMLAAAPLAAGEMLADEMKAACTSFQAQYPEYDEQQVQAACEHYMQQPAAVKHIAKQWLETAVQQGSPIAAQRIRGLTALGLLSAAPVPKRLQTMEAYLTSQLTQVQSMLHSVDDPDILVLPDNIRLSQYEEDDADQVWRKPLIYGAVALAVAFLFTVLMKSFFSTPPTPPLP